MLRLLTRIQSLGAILALMCQSKASNQTVECVEARPSSLDVQATYYAWILWKLCVYYCIPHLKSTCHVISDVYQWKLLLVTVSQMWLLWQKRFCWSLLRCVEPTEPGSFHQNLSSVRRRSRSLNAPSLRVHMWGTSWCLCPSSQLYEAVLLYDYCIHVHHICPHLCFSSLLAVTLILSLLKNKRWSSHFYLRGVILDPPNASKVDSKFLKDE